MNLNKFKCQSDLDSNMSYFLFEEKSFKTYVKYFLNLLLISGDLPFDLNSEIVDYLEKNKNY